MRSKGQISLNFDNHVNSKIFIPNFVCVFFLTTMSVLRFFYQALCAFLQIKDRKHIEQNFHSVAGIMLQGWDFGVLGGSKT